MPPAPTCMPAFLTEVNSQDGSPVPVGSLERTPPSLPVATTEQSLGSHAGLNVVMSFVAARGFRHCEDRLGQFVPSGARSRRARHRFRGHRRQFRHDFAVRDDRLVRAAEVPARDEASAEVPIHPFDRVFGLRIPLRMSWVSSHRDLANAVTGSVSRRWPDAGFVVPQQPGRSRCRPSAARR